VSQFEIIGSSKLSGAIKVAGNKNSVLPIMAASLLTQETCIIENVPDILDVEVMTKLLQLMGVNIQKKGTKLNLEAKNLKFSPFPQNLTSKLRASILLLAPALLRIGKIEMGFPGGDVIGRRSLESHTQVLTSLGAKIKEENGLILASADKLKGA